MRLVDFAVLSYYTLKRIHEVAVSCLRGAENPGWEAAKPMALKFERDEEKERINREMHGISFETASYVFRDEYYIEMYDFEHRIDEDRYIAIGMVGNLLFVVFTERRENIQLISARLATEKERGLYYDQNLYNQGRADAHKGTAGRGQGGGTGSPI